MLSCEHWCYNGCNMKKKRLYFCHVCYFINTYVEMYNTQHGNSLFTYENKQDRFETTF